MPDSHKSIAYYLAITCLGIALSAYIRNILYCKYHHEHNTDFERFTSSYQPQTIAPDPQRDL